MRDVGETSNLVSLPSEVSDAVLNGSNQERFNMPKLLKWFHRVEDSYKQGVRLVKVAMSASKVLRTVKIDQEVITLVCWLVSRRKIKKLLFSVAS